MICNLAPLMHVNCFFISPVPQPVVCRNQNCSRTPCNIPSYSHTHTHPYFIGCLFFFFFPTFESAFFFYTSPLFFPFLSSEILFTLARYTHTHTHIHAFSRSWGFWVGFRSRPCSSVQPHPSIVHNQHDSLSQATHPPTHTHTYTNLHLSIYFFLSPHNTHTHTKKRV
jgi:hypothetical protein